MKYLFWFVIVFFVCFFSPIFHDRYQAVSLNGRAFVLDKTTGETWISILDKDAGFFNASEMLLVPVEYGAYQYGPEKYLPDGTRDDANISLSALVKRKLFPPTDRKEQS